LIAELSKFVEKIPDYYFTEGIEPTEGLHIYIQLNDHGAEIKRKVYLIKQAKKQKEVFEVTGDNLRLCDFPNELIIMDYYSGIISTNKAIDIPSKKILTASPFVLGFKVKNRLSIKNNISNYYKKLSAFFEQKDQELISRIKNYSENRLFQVLKEIFDNLVDNIKDDKYIKIYYQADIKIQKNGYINYLSKNLFNKDDYNTKNGEYGLSGFLNGDNQKKPFLMHKSSRFLVNNRVHKKEVFNLYQFSKLIEKKKLPKPLPVFIDNDELNEEVIQLYNRRKLQSYHHIIEEIFREHKKDIGNYYIIYWTKYKDLRIHDLDYVNNFIYELHDYTISNLFDVKENRDQRIENIFQFENIIIQKIFNNSLVTKTKEGHVLYKYFDDIDSKYMTKSTYLNIIKYRKNIYDFIYKSKFSAISNMMFNDMMMRSITSDIKSDEIKNNYHTMDKIIKEKMNIYFSFNIKFGGTDMASKIPVLQEKLKVLLDNDDKHIESDEEFVFNAGQLIYYIISQSETANKSHAMLEPYLSKSNLELFKNTLTRGIDQYKHKLNFGTKRFQKLASEILGWESNISIKNNLPVLLAGYFSKSILYETTNKKGE